MSPFSKTTREKMRACAALGLHYWSDHPATGCVWAVDDNQQAHVVRLYRKTNQVALQAVGEPRRERYANTLGYRVKYRTYDAGERVTLTA